MVGFPADQQVFQHLPMSHGNLENNTNAAKSNFLYYEIPLERTPHLRGQYLGKEYA